MLFIVYGRFRKKATKEMLAEISKNFERMATEGATFKAQYWTLGRYDITSIVEAPDEKTLMRAIIRFGDMMSVETAVAVPREEAIKLVE